MIDTDDDGDGFSDSAEIAYGSDPRDSNSVANAAPSALDLNNSTLLENSPVGTSIGQLTATDPDSDSSLTFSLVTGNGSDHNSLFEIHQNQFLRSLHSWTCHRLRDQCHRVSEQLSPLNVILHWNPIHQKFQTTSTQPRSSVAFPSPFSMSLKIWTETAPYSVDHADTDDDGDIAMMMETAFLIPPRLHTVPTQGIQTLWLMPLPMLST